MKSASPVSIHYAAELHQKGNLDQAESMYLELIRENPRQFDAQHLLGVVYFQRGNFDRAVKQINHALSLRPNDSAALSNLGNVLSDMGRYSEAVDAYDKAISVNPKFATAYINRGNALKDLRRFTEALESFDKAQALEPNRSDIFLNRGTVLKLTKRYDEAIASFDRAISLSPRLADAHNNRANALKELNRYDEAIASFKNAIAANPKHTAAYVNLGNTLKDLYRLEEAAQYYDLARNLPQGKTLVEGLFLHTKMLMSDWDNYYELTENLREKVRNNEPVTTPFSLLALPSSADEQLQAAKLHVSLFCPPLKAIWNGERYNHDRIKVAYLSADYHVHATTHLMAGLFDLHDHKRFETIAISFGKDDKSTARQRLVKSFDSFIDVNHMNDEQVSLLLREREIDIIVDLKGYTQESRPEILSRKAAPLQVNYLGYPGTMGAPYIDYIVADHVLIPPEHYAAYSEKIVFLPDSYQVNDRTKKISPDVLSRDKLGLPEEAFVFCCFNNNYKITPDIFDVWMRLLKAVNGSVLWLLDKNPNVEKNLRKEAEKRGVAPERLVFAHKMVLEHHLARHAQADLFLDTRPYNAHTTASDALWAGLPVLTILGDTFASRVCASLLTSVGLTELITNSLSEYEATALQLATQPERLKAIKMKLAQNRMTCPLFDTERFTHHIEKAYEMMIERHRKGLEPETFSVPKINTV